MKKVLFALVPLLASQAAFAVEVGDHVRVERSQIQCQDVAPPPCHPHGYQYCDEFPSATSYGVVKLTGSVLGLGDLSTTVSSCAALNDRLDASGGQLSLEVTELTTKKVVNRIQQYITLLLNLGNENLIFQGRKTL